MNMKKRKIFSVRGEKEILKKLWIFHDRFDSKFDDFVK